MSKIERDYSETLALSLRGKVFSQIQNDILNGRYTPGDALTELKLSDELGVSRTPVREALRQLELEGLVQSIPNKGSVVCGVSSEDVEDIYTIRQLIEGLAARRATGNITEEELKELTEAVEFEEFYTMKNDTEHLMQLDSKFHEIIFRASKSNPLMHTLSTFHHYIQRARNSSFEDPGRSMQALEEHKAILQAIKEKNPSKAEKLTVTHIKNAGRAIRKNTAEGESSGS